MGIKNFWQFLKKYPISKTQQLKELDGGIFFVDVSFYCYKMITNSIYQNKFSNTPTELRDLDGDKMAHIIGLLGLFKNCQKANIKPFIIFDGVAGEEKLAEQEMRK